MTKNPRPKVVLARSGAQGLFEKYFDLFRALGERFASFSGNPEELEPDPAWREPFKNKEDRPKLYNALFAKAISSGEPLLIALVLGFYSEAVAAAVEALWLMEKTGKKFDPARHVWSEFRKELLEAWSNLIQENENTLAVAMFSFSLADATPTKDIGMRVAKFNFESDPYEGQPASNPPDKKSVPTDPPPSEDEELIEETVHLTAGEIAEATRSMPPPITAPQDADRPTDATINAGDAIGGITVEPTETPAPKQAPKPQAELIADAEEAVLERESDRAAEASPISIEVAEKEIVGERVLGDYDLDTTVVQFGRPMLVKPKKESSVPPEQLIELDRVVRRTQLEAAYKAAQQRCKDVFGKDNSSSEERAQAEREMEDAFSEWNAVSVGIPIPTKVSFTSTAEAGPDVSIGQPIALDKTETTTSKLTLAQQFEEATAQERELYARVQEQTKMRRKLLAAVDSLGATYINALKGKELEVPILSLLSNLQETAAEYRRYDAQVEQLESEWTVLDDRRNDLEKRAEEERLRNLPDQIVSLKQVRDLCVNATYLRDTYRFLLYAQFTPVAQVAVGNVFLSVERDRGNSPYVELSSQWVQNSARRDELLAVALRDFECIPTDQGEGDTQIFEVRKIERSEPKPRRGVFGWFASRISSAAASF